MRNNDRVIVEPRVVRIVLPTLLGDADILDEEDLMFTRFESITDNTTVDPKPDFYDGARLRDIDKRSWRILIRISLRRLMRMSMRILTTRTKFADDANDVPTIRYTAPVAPNFFLEAKTPRGGADVLKRQACHDGVVGARAMHKLQSYAGRKPVYNNNAYTITATYHAGTLEIYVTHVTSSPGGSLEYHMAQIGTWALHGDPNTY